MELLKPDTPVRLIQPVITGVVKEAKIIDNTIQYRVEYTGADGETHDRFFAESELEVVEA